MENLFLTASRKKTRFETGKGYASVEDLWDFNLESLNTIAIAVNKKLKEEKDESFIKTRSKSNTELELKLEILKYIIGVKLEEADEKKVKAEKLAQAATLRDLIATKKLEATASLSIEDLEKKLAEALS